MPQGWTTIPLRYVCELNPSISFDGFDQDDDLTFLPMERVKSGYFIPNTDKFSKLASSYAAFEDGDILLAKVTPCFENGNIAIAEDLVGSKGFGSSELFVVRPNGAERKFLFYYFQSSSFKQDGEASMTGAGGLKRVSPDVLRRHRLPFPSVDIQRLIANYLDRETARIDGLIAEKERMLTLLEEKRAVLISRVVTRGLDCNVPLKFSGHEWLGEIPAHWGLQRIKYVITSIDQGSSPIAANTSAGPDELGVLKLSAVSKGRFRRNENKALRRTDEEEQLLSLRKGDVLITRGNTPELVADVACVPYDEPSLLLPDLIYRLRVQEKKILPTFLTSFLTTAAARVQIRRDARGSSGSMVKVSKGHVLDWLTPVPPRHEQVDIVECLERAEERFQLITRKVSSSLYLLSERRVALVTAAVTGQIPLEEMTQ
jgi:type I restriction enzyme S subunit